MDLIPRPYSTNIRKRTKCTGYKIRGEQNEMEAIKISLTLLLMSPLLVLAFDVAMEFLYSQFMQMFKRGEL